MTNKEDTYEEDTYQEIFSGDVWGTSEESQQVYIYPENQVCRLTRENLEDMLGTLRCEDANL